MHPKGRGHVGAAKAKPRTTWTVWLDVKNSPEVLFFRPVIRRLRERGVDCVITSRAFAQTQGLLDRFDLAHVPIGRHAGGALSAKAIGLMRRSMALTRFGRGRRIDQVVSIGSNDLSVASRLLQLHNTVIQDFEFADVEHRLNFRLADKVLFPEAVPFASLARLGLTRDRYRAIPGLKEQVTLADFRPDDGVLDELGLDRSGLIAVLRPPAAMSLYNRGHEGRRFDAALEHLAATAAQIVLLPRDDEQARRYADSRSIMPDRPVDGPSLLYFADVVISGGGSMNREAAILGVPTWTVFEGTLGAVDRALVASGRMGVLERTEQLVLTKRSPATPDFEPLADWLTDELLDV